MGIWSGSGNNSIPAEITIKWLIGKKACHIGMLVFLDAFPDGKMPLTEENFNKFVSAHQEWFRNAVTGPLPWEEKKKLKEQALAKLTAPERDALGIA